MGGKVNSVLGKRILFGAAGVLFLILMFWIGGWFFNLSLIAAALIGTRELYAAFINKGLRPQPWSGYAAVVLFYLQHLYFGGRHDFIFIMAAVVCFLSLPVWFSSVRPIDTAVTMLGFFYPSVILVGALLLLDIPFIHRNVLLILTLIGTFMTDTFAFFVGSKFGRRKLCPAISPKKTVEGSIGGLLGSIFTVLLVGIVLNRVYNSNVNIMHFAAIGLLGGVFSQLGDLSASVIKRYCGIKDYGSIMPGHGGILDRIDSLLFVIPAVYIYALLFLAH
jgi:phosphatidate cytidylyltransferase